MINKLHHIGIAVKAIPEGFPKIYDPMQKVHVAFTHLFGVTIELIEPNEYSPPVHQFVRRNSRSVQLVHLCFEVNDIESAIEYAKKFNFRCIHEPVPAVAFANRKIAWLFNPIYGLIELLEE